MLSYSQADDCFYIDNGIQDGHIKAFEKGTDKRIALLKTHCPVTANRTCKVSDLTSPLLYHSDVGCVHSVKDCPTAYRLRLVP